MGDLGHWTGLWIVFSYLFGVETCSVCLLSLAWNQNSDPPYLAAGEAYCYTTEIAESPIRISSVAEY